MDFTKKANESWILTVTSVTNLTGRADKARLIVKKNKTDMDADAKVNQEVAVADPAAFNVVFTVTPTVTKDLDGQYFYEVWAYKTDKSDAIFCASGMITFTNPLLDTL